MSLRGEPAAKASRSLRDSAAVVGWGLAVWAAVQLAAAFFARNAMAATGIQAALAEWGTSRTGVEWSDPAAAAPTAQEVVRRVMVGAAGGALIAALGIAVALGARTAALSPGPMSLDALAVGLVVTVLAATRDELLLRGVVLRSTRDLLPAWGTLVACGFVAAAARAGTDPAAALLTLAAEALKGVTLGAIWTRDRGAWMAWGANIGWTWTAGAVARGGLLDVRFARDALTDKATLAVLFVVALLASVWATRTRPGAAPANAAS